MGVGATPQILEQPNALGQRKFVLDASEVEYIFVNNAYRRCGYAKQLLGLG